MPEEAAVDETVDEEPNLSQLSEAEEEDECVTCAKPTRGRLRSLGYVFPICGLDCLKIYQWHGEEMRRVFRRVFGE